MAKHDDTLRTTREVKYYQGMHFEADLRDNGNERASTSVTK